MRQRKLSVLTLIDSLSKFGGAERLAAKLTAGLDPERFDRFVCMTRSRPEPTFREELRSAGVSVLSLDRGSPFDVAKWWPLASFLKTRRVDILHAHKFGSNVWGTAWGRLMDVPVVIAHEHVWSFEGGRFRRFLDRSVVARGADVILTVSNETRRQMIAAEGIDPRTIHVLTNGIPDLPDPTGPSVRKEFGIASDARVIGTLSQLRPQKGLEVLIEASETLAERFPGIAVLIAGRGNEEKRLRTLIRDKGLEKVVLLAGPRQDVPEFLQALDVAVSCSHFEGSPLSVMEYMAAAKPIVATSVGGVPDLIEDGVHGLLVPPGDAREVADAVTGLLKAPDRAAAMGHSACERQQREFSLRTMVSSLEALYVELYRASRAGRREAVTACRPIGNVSFR
jgi:glycosyltransferase involved in cell wall biosynthesis